jgi:hypothetical protein
MAIESSTHAKHSSQTSKIKSTPDKVLLLQKQQNKSKRYRHLSYPKDKHPLDHIRLCFSNLYVNIGYVLLKKCNLPL